MNPSNERKEEAWILRRAQGEGEHIPDEDRNSQLGSERSTTEYQQVGSDRTDGESAPGCSPDPSREATLGGILRQLRELQSAHLAYVNAHTERLKARLEDDERHRLDLAERMKLLEEEVIRTLGDAEEEEILSAEESLGDAEPQ